MQESIVFLVRVQKCRRKESSRSLSHLLMSFLLSHPLGGGLRDNVRSRAHWKAHSGLPISVN